MSTSSKILGPIEQVRQRTSSKWRRFSEDVLPMHVAEMDYEIAESIKTLLIGRVSNSDLGYTGPVPEVAEGFAKFAKQLWNWEVDTNQVKLSTDVGVSAVEILRLLGKAGQGVVINSPVYSSFYNWVPEVGLDIVDVPLITDDGTWNLDLEGLEKAFAAGAKFYLLCSPHNPLGKVFTRDELQEISRLASKYEVVVISDEIHAPLTYSDTKFVPYLSVSREAKENGICITAASKSFNLAGLKASIIVTDSLAMKEKLRELPMALHWRSGLLGAFAMAEAFSNCTDWLNEANQLNAKHRDLYLQLVESQLPSVKTWLPDAGYLAWLDVSKLELGENPAAKVLSEQKVAFVPGQDLGKDYSQFLRINFACHPESIERAIQALAAYEK
jgi:cystathionine beta-lyase